MNETQKNNEQSIIAYKSLRSKDFMFLHMIFKCPRESFIY